MRVNREDLLRCLDAVSPGLSKHDVLEQSSCFVFRDGIVQTFNDEIACTIHSSLNIEGAIHAEPLTALLEKLQEDQIDLELKEGELKVKGKGRRAGIRCEAEVRLPIEHVDQTEHWNPLPEDFTEAIDIVKHSAGKNDSEFVLTCVHLTPEYIEASDNYQVTRYTIQTGLQSEILVRAESIKHLVGLDMTEFSETEAWIHFRNPAGLIYSCRRYLDHYLDFSKYLESTGERIVLPPGLVEAVQKAQIFSGEDSKNNLVTVSLKPAKLLLKGMGVSGWYEEQKAVTYAGQPMTFVISPTLLVDILGRTNECKIAPGRLIIEGGKFTYVGCLGHTDNGD